MTVGEIVAKEVEKALNSRIRLYYVDDKAIEEMSIKRERNAGNFRSNG
ncbi:hypothetical protein [Sulfurisphaera ohwakuensis]